MIRTEIYRETDKIRVKKDTFAYLTAAHLAPLQAAFSHPANIVLHTAKPAEILAAGRKTGARVTGITEPVGTFKENLIHGRAFSTEEVNRRARVALVNTHLANLLTNNQPATAIGKEVTVNDDAMKIIGVVQVSGVAADAAGVYVPLT